MPAQDDIVSCGGTEVLGMQNSAHNPGGAYVPSPTEDTTTKLSGQVVGFTSLGIE
eukprot:CAMPEP_0204886066 /NCGR_PEP_ID=MMETSP1349-20130617/14484_1 /ASSEMBLY_ACC=CAM_ASM_000710 /TAXON_ID=215587 /ORGANISM="Aplanochytrium stocchinoi, Strain GSBS06" /LENGTH=54 /DNA_ID=CAMNT_0052047955 /DNA_START=772 /DNA_END=936 /DNA_ORIENTATION=+